MRSAERLSLPYRTVNGGIAVSAGVVWAAIATAALANGHNDPGLLVLGAMVGLIAVGCLFLGVRIMRCEIVLTAHGVLTRNYLRTYWLSWSQVESVLLPYQGINGATVRLLRHDGSAVACRAATPASRSTPKARRLAKEYQHRLQQRLSQAQTRPDGQPEPQARAAD